MEFDFYIDIHAHSSQLNGFMYGNYYEDTTRTERQKLFPTLFSEFAPDFSRTDTVFDADRAKVGTGRRYALISYISLVEEFFYLVF